MQARRRLSHARTRVASVLLGCGIVFSTVPSASASEDTGRQEAARLNNLGVALMNQQLEEKAIAKFSEAAKADPALTAAEVNKGIAYLNLQKLPEAANALEAAQKAEPNSPRIWYNLGLLRRSEAKPEEAIQAFDHVAAIDPKDADTHYFLGSLYLQTQGFAKAKQEFETALRINPVHASAEFGLARALQRQGDQDAAREHLKRFQHLTQDKISSAITTVYGEQGPYSLVEQAAMPDPAIEPMIPVKLVAKAIGGETPPANVDAHRLGGGACLIDLGDGHSDLVVMGNGEHAIRAYRNDGGSFTEISEEQSGLKVSGNGVSCSVGDFDSDGLPDLAIATSEKVRLFRNLGGGKFRDVTKQAGIEQLNDPAGLTFVDFDHDGDLDLFITGTATAAGPNVLWRNNGNSTFTEWTKPTGLGGSGSTIGAVLSDINNDRAVDLVVSGSSAAPIVYLNPREGAFKPMPVYPETASLPPATGVYVFDFNKDGWMDVALTHAGAPGISLWRNVEGKRFERVTLPELDAMRGWGITAVDIDNDGWVDLAAVVETKQGAQVRVLRNEGQRGFEDASGALGLDQLKLTDPRSVIAADLSGSGAADLLVTQLNGQPLLLQNQGGNRNHALRLALTGLADNKSAIGTKVEVFAGGVWQKFEVPGGSGYLSQGSTEILAGMGKQDHADIVRMLWPTGVPQDEIEPASAKLLAVKELDRRGSSCPVLFAWNGTKYEFISDVIGAAVVGHWVSPTAKNIPDPDEWIKVEGQQLRERNGAFSLRFGEPMEEVNYVDQVRLVAIDHPEGTEVYPNERFLSEKPFAGEKVVFSSDAHPPAGAWDDRGNDVRELLRERDHKYVRNFTNLTFAGFSNPHTLTLDLGGWTPQHPLRLLMHGFVEYFSASSMYAAWQAGLAPVPPYVEAQMPDGRWKRVIDDMGFPAGLPRTIVVDLTGKLSPGTRRIRLVTNLQIYWDQVLVDNGPERTDQIRQTELPLASATLAFRGYPQQLDGKTPGDLTYDYERISQTGPFFHQRGAYTRYGDVTPLLERVDDRPVVFGSGEEVDAEFSAAALPVLPPRWKRDYFFYANGFVKDMDFYEAQPFTVAQMPFHRMTGYPYAGAEHFPESSSSVAYELSWNDRFESGHRIQPFHFDYRLQPQEQGSLESSAGAP